MIGRLIDRAVQTIGSGAVAVSAATRAGLVRPEPPDRLFRMLLALNRYGATPATGAAMAAARWPDRPGLIDEHGVLTFAELDRRSAALAAGLHARFGVGPGSRLAIMCRNHRGLVLALLAGSRIGADLVLLNTGFAARQLDDVLARERADAVLLDREFEPLLAATSFLGPRAAADHPSFDGLSDPGGPAPPAPLRAGRLILLTSGTTGTPKGAARGLSVRSLTGPFTSLLATVPVRSGDPILIAPPLFHAFGMLWYGMSLVLGCPVVLTGRFDPEALPAAVERHGVRALIAVPVMLERILAAPARPARSRLRMIMVSGSPLRPALARAARDAFGDVLYDLYGSTETGWGAIATPDDLREAPGTVGRPPRGTTVRILDESGADLPPGRTGRVFIGGGLRFAGYTGGGTRETIGDLMDTGDIGHWDEAGRLFIDGRADKMIISGGENVYPQEVEDLLAEHPAVAETAVVGVPDAEYGQRLAAYVVRRPGGGEVSAQDLQRYVRENLAGFKVPRSVDFVESLPRTASGKVAETEL
ncbi:MAG TPA: AMP-binding protein [Streptosporangiaceae bacterium]|nr:AMP-binding protein [Streptosporangiaceae bacterium]